MKIQAPPGMRDFYPSDWRLQNWLFERWRGVSRRFGFEEYEGPIFEFLDLYRAKSGEGIVSELFNLTDRGGREFAIRPEMTPTLARMVAARASALPRPLKWFSLPRMCRAEKPQRGRLREFFQWNVDVLGSDDPLADAEVIAVLVTFSREVGLTDQDVTVKLNSRPMMGALLAGFGITPEESERAIPLIDRWDKLDPPQFAGQWDSAFGGRVSAETIRGILARADLAECAQLAARQGPAGAEAAAALEAVRQRLDALSVGSYCRFSPAIVRGLAYYTGVVFELHTCAMSLRALCGGGRYDDLTSLFGSPRVSGVGFGMGDAPLLEALRELNRLPQLRDAIDLFVIDADASVFPAVLEIVGRLRSVGSSADFSYKRQALGKQLKQASDRGARLAVIVDNSYAQRGEVAVKDLESGVQRNEQLAALLERIGGAARAAR